MSDIESLKNPAQTITSLQSKLAEAERALEDARAKIAMQAMDVARKDETLRKKNIALDGMGWVWCDGGCERGVGRFTEIEVTEEMVSMIERNATRLRQWFKNRAFRTATIREEEPLPAKQGE